MSRVDLPPLPLIGALALAAIALVALTWHDDPAPFRDELALRPEAAARTEPISPIPKLAPEDPAKLALGERLFRDPLLSADRTISCASCHDLDGSGSDRRARSSGVGGALGLINSPTVFNVRFNFAQFWDGRAQTLEEQVAGPLHDPREMASTWDEVISRIEADEAYRRAFAAAYREGITPVTVADAIASFERSLVTPDAPFDRYLRGETSAISAEAAEGYARFKSLGCASCHQGVNVGGNLYQRFGVMDDYFADRQDITRADLGRYNVTGRDEDRHVFKVPSLRNVAATPPYFHDGSATDLEDAVEIMGRYQLGRALDDDDLRVLTAFLRTLSGNYRGVPIK